MNQISHTQKIGHSRQALPFGARPLSGAMLVFTQISSMNTDRRGSIRPQWCRHRSRRRFTSARSRSSAISVFLETKPRSRAENARQYRASPRPRAPPASPATRPESSAPDPTANPDATPEPGGDTRPSSQASPSRSAPRAASTSQRPTAQLQTAPQPGDNSLRPVSRKQHVREDHSGKVASSIPASFTVMDSEPHPILKENPNPIHSKTEPI